MKARLSTLTLALTTALAGFAVTPAAHAAPAGHVVTFGDSFTANPDQVNQMVGDKILPWLIPADYPRSDGCLQAPDNWSRRLGAQTGIPIADYSCTAQTSRTVAYKIDSAIRHGDLSPATRAVVLALGMNNYGPYGAADGVNISAPDAVRESFLADMRANVAKIRATAPGAKVIIAGSLAVADPATAQTCIANVVPNAPAGLPIPVLRDVENWNRQNQADAAAQTGAAFVDVRSASLENHTCAPDALRGTAGIVDTTSPSWNFILHPTSVGSDIIANQVASAL